MRQDNPKSPEVPEVFEEKHAGLVPSISPEVNIGNSFLRLMSLSECGPMMVDITKI